MTPPPDCWHISAADIIDWHEWGDEFVIRVASRAETHLLSAAAGTVLLALLGSQSSLTLDALAAKAFGDPQQEAAQGHALREVEQESLQAILADFERLGIVTRQTA